MFHVPKHQAAPVSELKCIRVGSKYSWVAPDRSNEVVATVIQTYPLGWLLRIPGHEWPLTEGMWVSKFQEQTSHTPVLRLRSFGECEAEIQRLLRSRTAG